MGTSKPYGEGDIVICKVEFAGKTIEVSRDLEKDNNKWYLTCRQQNIFNTELISELLPDAQNEVISTIHQCVKGDKQFFNELIQLGPYLNYYKTHSDDLEWFDFLSGKNWELKNDVIEILGPEKYYNDFLPNMRYIWEKTANFISNTEGKIKEAIKLLRRMKKKISKTAIAYHKGMKREHVSRKYSYLFLAQ